MYNYGHFSPDGVSAVGFCDKLWDSSEDGLRSFGFNNKQPYELIGKLFSILNYFLVEQALLLCTD
jgi:hypothetical protein